MKADKDFRFIFASFIGWRLTLFVFIFLAISFVSLQQNFLGGGFKNYSSSPYVWAWANFDGEHYLAIARRGFGFGEQAFFPLYPLLIKAIGGLLGGGRGTFNLSGQLISNISFLFALFGLYKLVRLDYSRRIAKLTVVILLLFPTSFYFVSVYTESLFLALVIWSFYFARKGNWLVASLFGSLASATRVIGILLLPILLIERYRENKREFKDFLYLLLIPVGLLIYMFYLKQTTGDWLAYLSALPSFGEQRSATPILLPQVFYRYFFKVLPNLNYSYFPVVFTTLLETLTGIIFLIISIWSFFRIRLSYALYLLLGYLVPTLSGSFSSLPRYVLVLFPAFLLIAVWISKRPKVAQVLFFGLLFILLGIALSLFSRGYWLS